MSEVQVTIEQLELQLESSKEQVALRDAAQRLWANRDFKKVILEAFMVKECARYAQTSADPALDLQSRADALALAQASGHLKRFLSVVIQMGNSAESQIGPIEDALDEDRAKLDSEEAEGGAN